ncbi:MAG: hypothetical protein VXZ38_11430, partial [Planctomycetota bacterium]|nr:hypothetical protein [Planctomycetota bacterium]
MEIGSSDFKWKCHQTWETTHHNPAGITFCPKASGVEVHGFGAIRDYRRLGSGYPAFQPQSGTDGQIIAVQQPFSRQFLADIFSDLNQSREGFSFTCCSGGFSDNNGWTIRSGQNWGECIFSSLLGDSLKGREGDGTIQRERCEPIFVSVMVPFSTL